MTLQTKELTMTVDKQILILVKTMVDIDGYPYATGYLGSFLRNIELNLNLTEEQVSKLQIMLDSAIKYAQYGKEN